MINAEQLPQALNALQRLIVHAKSQAYDAGNRELCDFLNDIELLPEYVADEWDRTDDFIEMLQGIAQTHPSCRYIVAEFERTPAQTT